MLQRKTHVQLLLDIGITGEIDLEEERQETPPKVDAYLWLPVTDKHAPTLGQLEIGVAAIEKMIKQGRKVFVHCKWGHGRSPTMVAAYLISAGSTPEKAMETIKSARPEVHLEDAQMEVLRAYASK